MQSAAAALCQVFVFTSFIWDQMKIFLWNICQPCGLRFKQVEQPWKLVSTVMSHSFMSLKQVYREVQVHLWVYGNVVKTTLPVDLKLVFYFFILNLWTFYLFIDCFAWLEQNMSFLLIPKKADILTLHCFFFVDIFSFLMSRRELDGFRDACRTTVTSFSL